MRVFVLEGLIDYSPSEVLAVASTLERAKAFAETLCHGTSEPLEWRLYEMYTYQPGGESRLLGSTSCKARGAFFDDFAISETEVLP